MSKQARDGEESYILPNSFQTPNAYVDEAMYLLTPEEYVVLSFIDRHILGWHEKIMERKGVISLTMLVNGYQSKKTGRWFHGTGLSRPTVNKCLDSLCAYGFIVPEGKPTPKGQTWVLGDFPDYEALRGRAELENQRTAQRMAKVRGKSDELVNDIGAAEVNDITPEPTIYDLRKQRHLERQSLKTKEKDIAPASDDTPAYMTASLHTADDFDLDGDSAKPPTKKKAKAKDVTATTPLPKGSAQKVSPAAQLANALNLTPVDSDWPKFGKVAGTLNKAGITCEEFIGYVFYWREMSKRTGNWDVTLHALIGGVRMSEFCQWRSNMPEYERWLTNTTQRLEEARNPAPSPLVEETPEDIARHAETQQNLERFLSTFGVYPS